MADPRTFNKGFSVPKAGGSALDAYASAQDTIAALSGDTISPDQVRIGDDGTVYVNYGQGEARLGNFAALVGGQDAGGGQTVEDFLALGFSLPQAQQAAQAAALFGTGASAGVAEKILFGSGAGAGGGAAFAPPSLQFDVDERTGELLTFNPQTGQVQRTGEQVGFAGINPRELAREEVRRGENAQALDVASLAEQAAQARGGLRENARQADQSAALSEFNTRANLVPAFGNIALGASQQQREILSQGKDYLARAFGQANQESPLGLVTQGDMLNSLMRDLEAVERLIPESRATGRTAFQDMPAFAAPQFDAFPGFGAAPIVTRGSAAPAGAAGDAAGGGGATGAGGGAGFAAPSGIDWSTVEGLPRVNAIQRPGEAAASAPAPRVGRMGAPDEADMSRGPSFARVPGYAGRDALVPESSRLYQGQWDVSPGSGLSVSPEQGGGGGGSVPGFIQRLFGVGVDRSSRRGRDAFGQPVSGYNEGTVPGFTTEHLFAAGEEGAGRLGKTGELIVNPTGAPVGVVSNDDIPTGTRVVSGYEHGTARGGGGEGEDAPGFDPEFARRFLQSQPMDRDALMSVLPMGGLVRVGGRMVPVADDVARALGQFDDAINATRSAAEGLPGAASAIGSRIARLKGVVPGFASGTGIFDVNIQRGGETLRLGDLPASEFGFLDPTNTIKFGDLDPEIAEQYRSQGVAVDSPFGGVPGANSTRRGTTQQDIIGLARAFAPPRVMQVRNGKLPQPANTSAGMPPGFRAPTARMVSALGEQDQGALNTLLNAESSGRTDLGEILGGNPFLRGRSGRRGRVAGPGF